MFLRRFKDRLNKIVYLVLVSLVAQSFFQVPISFAATCAVTTTMTIDQAYVNTNNCDVINASGTITLTVSSIDLVGAGAFNVTSGTVTLDGALSLGATDDFTISSGATVTHAQGNPTGVNITADDITINGTGAINTNVKGCIGGVQGDGVGQGVVIATGACSKTGSVGGGLGTAGGGGGGHGGNGGNSGSGGGSLGTGGSYFDSQTAPAFLGTGGSAETARTGADAGDGGGLVVLNVAGTLTVAGSITANASSSVTSGGGGSGGGIYIRTGTLAGAGTITATGGAGSNGNQFNGGGSGGSIAVFYNTLSTFTLSNISAAGGAASGGDAQGGSAGTTFVLDRKVDDGVGTLTIRSGLRIEAATDLSRTNITTTSGASLRCETASSASLSASATLTLPSTSIGCDAVDSLSISANTLTQSGASSWSVSKAGSTFTLTTSTDTSLTSVTYNGGLAGTSSSTGGVFSFPGAVALTLTSSTFNTNFSAPNLTSFNLASGSINANGKGCIGGTSGSLVGKAPNSSTGICGSNTGGGGSSPGAGGAGHGAAGGVSGGGAAGGSSYDSSTAPVLYGAGGGSESNSFTGATGGGKVRISATGNVAISGSITANASSCTTSSCGGGSGGSIFITAGGTLSGAGTMTATGSAGVNGTQFNGGGAGGRIRGAYSSITYTTGNATAGGGAASGGGAGAGGAGTVSFGTLSVPTTPSVTAPSNGAVSVSPNPTMTSSAYASDGANQTSSDWKITTDNGGNTIVWSKTGDASNLTSIVVNSSNGTFAGSLSGYTQLASSTTYYAFVRHNNSVGSSSWSAANSFTTQTLTSTLSTATQTVNENVGSVSVTAQLNGVYTSTVTIPYTVTGTATGSGTDHNLADGNISVSANASSGSVSFNVVDDFLAEGGETVIVTLGSPSVGNTTGTTVQTITITDNDSVGITVTQSGGTTNVTEGGATDSYTVVLTSQPTASVTVSLAPGTQVSLDSAALTFTTGNWSSPQTVLVTAVNDQVAEGAHTGTISQSVTSGDGAYNGFVLSIISANITDNDTAGITVTQTDASTDVTEGGATDSYTIVLTSQPTASVTVNVSGSVDASVSATTLTFTTGNWNTPQTIVVTAVNDDLDEDLQTVSVTHTSSSADTNYNNYAIASVSVNVTDNDSVGVSYSSSSLTGTEGTNTTYSIVLTSEPTADVVVNAAGDAQASVSPTTLTFTSADWDTPQIVTVTILDDVVIESSHTATLTHSLASGDLSYHALTAASITVNITDNDVTVSPTPTIIGGGGASGGNSHSSSSRGDDDEDQADLDFDTPDHWSQEYLNHLKDEVYVLETAVKESTFFEILFEMFNEPNGGINRGQSVEFLLVFGGVDIGTILIDSTRLTFSDVSADYKRAAYIQFAYESKLIQGYPDGTFLPEKTLNRAESLKLALKFFNKDLDVSIKGQALLDLYGLEKNPFRDVDINAWYAPYVLYMYSEGVVKGYADGSFRPEDPVSFAEYLKVVTLTQDIENAVELSSEFED